MAVNKSIKEGHINFFKEGVAFRMTKADDLRIWLIKVAKKEGAKIEALNYIFCTDRYLRKMNVEHLQHDFNTDVITFDYSEVKNEITGDIFISIDRVKANAAEYSTTFKNELARVMVHGLLHLLGYDDKTEAKRKVMKEKENTFLMKN